MNRITYLLGAIVLLVGGGAAAAVASGDYGGDTISTITTGHTPVTICHKPGTEAEQTLVVDDDAVPGHLGHGDYLGECQPVVTTTGTTTETTPTTPTTPRCPPGMVPTNGKDGAAGNDECQLPTTTVVTPPVTVTCPPPTTNTVTQTVTQTVTSKPKIVTRVVHHTKIRTRVIYRTRVITKIKKVYVPGLHKNGAEGSG